MSSFHEKSQNRRTVARTRNSNFCSTPVEDQQARRPSSIGVSTVETNSSSTTTVKSRRSRGQTVAKEPKKKQRKRKRKQESKARRKKRPNVAIDSDSDWVTRSEQSVHEEVNSQRGSTQRAASNSENDVLFKDTYGSPERVREARHFVDDDRLESPLFRSRRREFESPEKIGFGDNEGILPVEDLPSHQARVDDVDEKGDTEEELILKRRGAVVMYPGTRQEKRRKINGKIDKCQGTLADASYPIATANLLWDDFVRDNYEKISKYIAPTASCWQRSSLRVHQERQSNEGGERSDSDKNQSSEKAIDVEWTRIKPDLREMNVTCGHWDKSLKKWVRVEDVYKFPQPEDPEFQKSHTRRKRMTLNEYLHKCKIEKENLRNCSLDSCSLVTSQYTEKGSKRLKSDLYVIQKETIPCKNVEYEFERSNMESTTQTMQHTLTRFPMKRTNVDIHNGDAKRRVIAKNKPRITSIEVYPKGKIRNIYKTSELFKKQNAD